MKTAISPVELALIESADMSLGGTSVMLYCGCCADECGIPTNMTLDELLNPAMESGVPGKLEQVVCGVCYDVIWDMDDVLDGRNYDPDEDRALDSDPYEGDCDEYEPGGAYFDRCEQRSHHTIHGQTYGRGRVQAQHWTNDNLDYGYPNETGNWVTTYESVEAFRKICGYTRQGIGCYVEVWLDGVQQFSPEEMARLARIEDLGKHLSDELTRLLGEFSGATYREVAAAVARMNPEAPL